MYIYIYIVGTSELSAEKIWTEEDENDTRLDKNAQVKKRGGGKAISVADCGGPWSCEMSRLTHFLDNWLIEGGEVVSNMHKLRFTPQEGSWYSFLLEAE
jgi:hypothetical protein